MESNPSLQTQKCKLRKPAPHFQAQAWWDGQIKPISLDMFKGKYVVLFFYPLDFTFVCPTEIIQFNDRRAQFEAINCQVIACSIDSPFSHRQWTMMPRNKGGLGEMNIPMMSDLDHKISQAYGCDCEDGDIGVSFRATYIIDGNGILRQASYNDIPVGRDVGEFLRLVKALQHTDVHGEVCPASWTPGQTAMVPDHDSPELAQFFESGEAISAPSMAQTHFQGPLSASQHGPLTREEVDNVKAALEKLLKVRPDISMPRRLFMDVPDVKWRFKDPETGKPGPPDYSVANYAYAIGKSCNHYRDPDILKSSPASIVEDLVKSWEAERSHKIDPTQHLSVNQERFSICGNQAKRYNNVDANKVGNYNLLLANADTTLYDSENTTWEESHAMFHKAFMAFPWEVLEVLTFPDIGNPNWPNCDNPDFVTFTWRHWGDFTGEYKGNKGKGERIDMYGFATARISRTGPVNLSDGMPAPQLCEVDLYFDANTFLKQMEGKIKPDDPKWNHKLMGTGCPFLDAATRDKCRP